MWYYWTLFITEKFILYILYSLDIPANEILELFGRMFFEFCQDSGYDKILQVLGATPRDFLQVKFENYIYYRSLLQLD